MIQKLKHILIGQPLRNEAIHGQQFSAFWGLPLLASDAISSVAYASEQILLVLIPAIGILAYRELGYISAAIIVLLAVVTISYRQIIQTYPNGGGSYVVATDNLGAAAGVTAGASLAVDYVLTVAVSISAGTAALTSAFPGLYPYTVPICLVILALVMLGNLRGLRESARIFCIPTYAFLAAMLVTIAAGIIKYLVLGAGAASAAPGVSLPAASQPVTLVLLLSAFSNGCSALTGVEAVSNAIPNFRRPQIKNAQKVLLLLSLSVLLIFGGVSTLANLYHAVPRTGNTVLSQIANAIYGHSAMYFVVQVTTAIILVMAANTSYSGFPMLMSLIARDGYAPRQLTHRGDRLSFSNGILILSVMATVLIVVFRGDVSLLIPLYAIGVFISFTLSQFGMLRRWVTRREPGWTYKACINGFGALMTAVVVLIIGVTKFHKGAWIVILVIPLLVIGMLHVKKHYATVANQLRVKPEELKTADIDHTAYRNRVIVPMASITRASLRALKYAQTISDHVIAFNVSIDEESGKKLQKKYALLHTKIPLYVKYSPYRKIVEPLLQFIDSEEYDYTKGDMITVILPEFEVKHRWQRFLHNGTGQFVMRQLLKYRHIVVATMPLQLHDEGLLFRQRQA